MSAGLTCDEIRELAAPFVLGALEADEAAAVRDHLRDCPDPHPEFVELGSVVPALAESVEQVDPPPALKGRILAAAAADLAPRDAVPEIGAPLAFPAAAERTGREEGRQAGGREAGGRQADRRRPASALGWVLRVAAVLAIVALGAWSLLLQGRLAASETYARDVAAVLDVAAQPGALTAVLAPSSEGGPRGLAAIAPNGSVTMAVRDLVPTSGAQVYEAWAIVGDAAPAPLGGFGVGAAGTGRLDATGVPVEPGVVLALTLEPGPGATAPSSPPVAVGTALAPPGDTSEASTETPRGEAVLGYRAQRRIATVSP